MTGDDVLVSTILRVEDPEKVAEELERAAALIRDLRSRGFDVEIRGTVDIEAERIQPTEAGWRVLVKESTLA